MKNYSKETEKPGLPENGGFWFAQLGDAEGNPPARNIWDFYISTLEKGATKRLLSAKGYKAAGFTEEQAIQAETRWLEKKGGGKNFHSPLHKRRLQIRARQYIARTYGLQSNYDEDDSVQGINPISFPGKVQINPNIMAEPVLPARPYTIVSMRP